MRLSLGLGRLITVALVAFAIAQSANGAGTRTTESPSVSAAVETPSSGSGIVKLAAAYEHGEAVAQDYSKALTLYCEAARLGEAKAFLSLGWMYLNGRGVPRDDSTAVAWLRKAADKGVVQAANLLSLLQNTAPAKSISCGPAPRLASAPPRLRRLVERTAEEVGIDAKLVIAVIAVESGFDSRAVSPRDAQGLMQLMPETAARFGVQDPFDEAANVHAGATYLKVLLQQFRGDLTLALAAYNAGEAAIDLYRGVPPYRETRDYIDRVKRLCTCDRVR